MLLNLERENRSVRALQGLSKHRANDPFSRFASISVWKGRNARDILSPEVTKAPLCLMLPHGCSGAEGQGEMTLGRGHREAAGGSSKKTPDSVPLAPAVLVNRSTTWPDSRSRMYRPFRKCSSERLSRTAQVAASVTSSR
jgi:hypothetical protein